MKYTPFCADPFNCRRRLTREVRVGKVGVGGHHPIRVQSMITCDTMDTQACIRQTMELAAVGCEIVRITAPTVKDAQNLRCIKSGITRERLRCAHCRRYPFQTGGCDGSGSLGRKGAY